jgi:AraC-like DNA-binding protein
MDYRAVMQESIDYMEDNLTAEIAPAELAARAGFSLYHYYRLFQNALGMPLGQYLTRRRLLHGAFAMAQGKSGIDAALAFGFDTYAGFYRAFRREFGCTVSEFLEAGRGKEPRRINLL